MVAECVFAIEPVWSWNRHPIGAVYIEYPGLFTWTSHAWQIDLALVVASSSVLLLFIPPIGGIFGWLTTRGIVERIARLVRATNRFASGDSTQRVVVKRRDEIGQLEDHFNRMAEQLVETTARRQELAEENARLAERASISRDLHDIIKQRVFALAMQISAALTLIERDRTAAQRHLIEADTLAYQAQQELTTLIHQFRPMLVAEKGLPAALRDYVQTWSRQHDIAAEIVVPDACHAPPEVETALVRVAQETLANVARHSRARHVQLELRAFADGLDLSISDDGRGFDPVALRQAGVGLQSLRERLRDIGGTLAVISVPDHGTQITARWRATPQDGESHEADS